MKRDGYQSLFRKLYLRIIAMKINGKDFRSVWYPDDRKDCICIIDQRRLPHFFETETLASVEDAERAIREMHLRGAPLIGIAAAYGMYFAALACEDFANLREAMLNAERFLNAARPTAVNLAWATDRVKNRILAEQSLEDAQNAALAEAEAIAREDAEQCRYIGVHGLSILKELSSERKDALNLLTHCNAGWLACMDYGTATAPIYLAQDAGIKLHVWVDETRPRNQGANLTAWELGQHGVPHTVITDNAGGLLMQRGMVDVVITGCDRAARNGDAANKIGTYLKALAARAHNIPFYVALPSTTFDWKLEQGVGHIEIEERDPDEIHYVWGLSDGAIKPARITPEDSPAANYGFDITPAELITGFITERGVCAASSESLKTLFPEKFIS